MELIEFCAPCLFGIEGVLGDELRRLGAENVRPENGRVLFSGDCSMLARANISSRYAERILIVLGRFTARTFDQLFEGVRALPWERWIGRADAFPVKGTAFLIASRSLKRRSSSTCEMRMTRVFSMSPAANVRCSLRL